MATFQTAGYPVPPAAFATTDYFRTPPMTPPHTGGHATYYSPRHYSQHSSSTPSKAHHRRSQTNDVPTGTYTTTYTTYTSPRKQAHYSTDFGYFTSAQSTPQQAQTRKNDYVSGSERRRERARTYHPEDDRGDGAKTYQFRSSGQHHSSRANHVDDQHHYNDRSDEYLPRYEQYESRPPPYNQNRQEHRADHNRYRDQVPIYTPADNTAQQQSHRRRASYAAKPTPTPQRHRPSTATREKPTAPKAKATEEDARKAGIPAGYSLKNWDPAAEPILLLGSVFDADSLGRWIFDWTVFAFGPSTPMSEIAGELWLLLIQLSYKIKRAEDSFPNIRSGSNRDMIDDFLESGERLWQRFNKLLKICENYMWKVAKRENPNSKNVTMGKNSGCEFVDAIFGRDRELERTEKLMTGMRLWTMRFDANCEEILKNPSA